jgi:hypothetical protein
MPEDNTDRIKRFTETIRTVDSDLQLVVWKDAHAMVREIGLHLAKSRLICLDHDLEAIEGAGDPGDGLLLVRFLISQPIIRPVIIHSSNFERSSLMERELKQARWPISRVVPIGDDWIEEDWRRTVRTILDG